MSEALALFNGYVLKARIYPALILTLPIGITITVLWPGIGIERLGVLAAAAGLPFVIANVVRGQGQRLQRRLEQRWGGMPTTQMLRLTDQRNNPDLLRRRRHALQDLIGEDLPTPTDEQNHPQRSDERYTAAIRLLITKLGDTRETHPRVHEELTNYGFWRNSLAIKPIAMISLIILLGIDAWSLTLGRDPQLVGVTIGVTVLAILFWAIAVRPSRVLQHGQTYATRLLETLDWAPATPPSPPS